jgi:hypothetical protein
MKAICSCASTVHGDMHRDAGASTSDSSRGFGKGEKSGNAEKGAGVSLSPQDRKWELQAHDVDEWREWLLQQKSAANVTGDNVFVQVGLLHCMLTVGITVYDEGY